VESYFKPFDGAVQTVERINEVPFYYGYLTGSKAKGQVKEESIMIGMTLDLAEECIRRAKLKAAEIGANMSIAVVDDTGKLVAYAHMGDKRGGFGEKKTIAKARTAMVYRRDTKASMEDFANRPGNYFIIGMSAMYPDEFWAGPGGAPIIIGGKLVGGLGVSGSSPENDHRCVTEALAGLEIDWLRKSQPSTK
jgi:uncharacterized protein GlcG (DUF336 family)